MSTVGASPLRVRDFRLFYAGRVTSDLGTAGAPVAVTFAVLARGGGASLVGLVLAAEAVPLVLFLLAGGVLADRVGPRAALLGADLMCGAAQATLAGWLLVGRPGVAVFMACGAVLGTGAAVAGPALTALLPALVTGQALQPGNALVGISQSLGEVIGPALAGLAVATVGPGWAIGADALTYLASFACLLYVRSGGPVRRDVRRHPIADLAAGWREFRRRTWLWVIVAQFSLWSMLVYAPVMVLGPVQAQLLAGGARTWGLVLAAAGVGATAAGVVVTRWRPPRPLVVGTLVMATWSLPPLLLAAGTSFVAVGVAAALAGTALGVFGPLWQTSVQQQVPAESLARVSAYDGFGSLAFLPVGYALAGPLSLAIGVGPTLVLAAAVNLALIPVVLAVPSVRAMRPMPVAGAPA